MPNLKTGTLVNQTVHEFERSIELTARATIWQSKLRYFQPARFNADHFIQIVELAFMNSFLTWETFLEEAFTLYLLGKTGPTGYKPFRHAIPLNRQHAAELLATDRGHTDWTSADQVLRRAKRFFKNGEPFVSAIRPRTHLLKDIKTIRNAVSHSSDQALESFRSLVRNALSHYPSGMEPGGFLMTLVPTASSPPKTFLQFYAETFRTMTKEIIPT